MGDSLSYLDDLLVRSHLFLVVLYHLFCVLVFQSVFKLLQTRAPKFINYSGKVILSRKPSSKFSHKC